MKSLSSNWREANYRDACQRREQYNFKCEHHKMRMPPDSFRIIMNAIYLNWRLNIELKSLVNSLLTRAYLFLIIIASSLFSSKITIVRHRWTYLIMNTVINFIGTSTNVCEQANQNFIFLFNKNLENLIQLIFVQISCL